MPRKNPYSLPKDYIDRLRVLGYQLNDINNMGTEDVQSILLHQVYNPSLAPTSTTSQGAVDLYSFSPESASVPSSKSSTEPKRTESLKEELDRVQKEVNDKLEEKIKSAKEGVVGGGKPLTRDQVASETERLQNLADAVQKASTDNATTSGTPLKGGAAKGKKEKTPEEIFSEEATLRAKFAKVNVQRTNEINSLQHDIFRAEIANKRAELAFAKASKTEQDRVIGKAQTEAKAEDKLRTSQAGNTAFYNEKIAPYPKVVEAFTNVDPRFADPTKATYKEAPMQQGYKKTTASFVDEYGKTQTLPVVSDANGNAVDILGKKYKSFGEQLRQNYSEVLRWTIAVSLLYAPMQKLNELTTEMIQNQSRLAQVAVTLGTTTEANNRVFEAAAKIAKETGTSVEGVIEGYNLAVRATGDASTATE